MNIVLTNTFILEFKKKFRKNNFSINKFVNKLKKEKILKLQYPFFKVKLNMNNIAVRWIVFLNINNKVIPVFFVLKKDKKYWENLLLDKNVKSKINLLMEKFQKDFKDKNFIEY